MKNTKFISITLSLALVSALGLSGCGSSSKAPVLNIEKTNNSEASTVNGANVLSGKVVLDETPTEQREVRSLSSRVYSISAYNLDTKKVYKTTTDSRGLYTLSNLSDGEYQIIAENDKVSKSAIKRVVLTKGSRKVVDFTLQAAGSVKGHIDGARVVFIPGKDYVSYADENGNFELTNIPVGTYKLGYFADNGKGFVDISVTTGLSDLGDINVYSNVVEVDTNLPLGVLELRHDGLKFHVNSADKEAYELLKGVKLLDSEGKEVEIEVKSSYGENDEKSEPVLESRENEDYYLSYGRIVTKDIVSAGEYTLVIPASDSKILDKDIKYTFNVSSVSVVVPEYDYDTSSRMINIYIPHDISSDKQALFSSLKVKEKGSTAVLNTKIVWSGNNHFSIFGGFKSGVEYEIELSDEQKELLGVLKPYRKEIKFNQTEISGIYPYSGQNNVPTNLQLVVYVDNMAELNPASIKVILKSDTQTKEFSKNDIIFDSNNYYGYSNSFSVGSLDLKYGKNYTVEVQAEDIYGNKLEKDSSFSTLSPKVIKLEPEDMSDIFDGEQKVEFNVDLQKDTGSVKIEDMSESSDASVEIIKDRYDYSSQSVRFRLKNLLPEHKYKITVSGYKTYDGVEIEEKSTEFTAPPRMMFIDKKYRQNVNVNPDDFKHKVELSFFGKLSDKEKKFIEDHLVVTSYAQVTKIDATHPVRKLFFNDTEDGTSLIVAFTIDKDTNYELSFNDISGLSDIVLPRGVEVNRPFISFATIRNSKNSDSKDGISVINRMDFNVDESMKNSYLNIEFSILGNRDYDHKSYKEVCRTQSGLLGDDEAIDLLKESLQISDQNSNVDYSITNYNMYGTSDYSSNSFKSVCRYNVNVKFQAGYNKKYKAVLDFTDTLSDSFPSHAKLLTKEFKTDDIGKLKFWTEDNKNSDAIKFNIKSNAPIVNSNLKEILHLNVDGIDKDIPMVINTIADDDTSYDKYSMGESNTDESVMQKVDSIDSITFLIPRTAYSVSKFTLSKDSDAVLKFYDRTTQSSVENSQILSEPMVFVESVSPDLIPLKVDDVQTTSTDNDSIKIKFNRAVSLDNIVKFNQDSNGTKEITDISFKVEDESGENIAIVDVLSLDNDRKEYELKLASSMDVSKEYKLLLNDGKSIQVAFGVQKLNSYESVVKPTLIGVNSAYIIRKDRQLDTSESNPFELGSSESLNSSSSDGLSQVVVDINTIDGVKIDLSKSRLEAIGYGQVVSEGPLSFSDNKLVEKIKSYYNSLNEVNIKLSYIFNGVEQEFKSTINSINKIDVANIYSISGNGLNTIRFNLSMQQDYKITKDNFRVYDMDGKLVESDIEVQFDGSYSTSSPNVTFNGLEADTVYRVDVVGVPSYYSGSIDPDIVVGSIYIKTTPEKDSDVQDDEQSDQSDETVEASENNFVKVGTLELTPFSNTSIPEAVECPADSRVLIGKELSENLEMILSDESMNFDKSLVKYIIVQDFNEDGENKNYYDLANSTFGYAPDNKMHYLCVKEEQ